MSLLTRLEEEICLSSEKQNLFLQSIGAVDEKTSSWLRTDAGVRTAGGALFGVRHHGRTFVCCNGAEPYYSSEGFRTF